MIDTDKRASQLELHQHFVDSLGANNITSSGPLKDKPLLLNLRPPLPEKVRVYLYNATRPPGGRPLGEHKAQLIVPGQARGVRGNFDNSDGRLVLLVGYVQSDDIFILWDSGLYSDFAWSRNVQAKMATVISAVAGNIATQKRKLRRPDRYEATEELVASRSDLLVKAIIKRVLLTRKRIIEG